MIKIENILEPSAMQWETVIMGARNPMNSWKKSDSQYYAHDCFDIGNNDLDLMTKLVKAGTDHRKFMRMIVVYADITAPLYWWKEYDTYKVGTVANSCSTMHKIHEKEFTLDDFSCEHCPSFINGVMETLENWRKMYLETKNKEYWYSIIQLLPSSYNQKRTVMLNYEVLKNMYHSRKNHKLDEWKAFCDFIEQLPYAKELICNE